MPTWISIFMFEMASPTEVVAHVLVLVVVVPLFYVLLILLHQVKTLKELSKKRFF